ncbi:Pyrimidine pathway regulatory protein 1 [Diplodia seriata]|uniref:Pyrimidine pathway regulatory protein 1 n=1 Tax=Diplodia seriata TaxID=420778 RepID=A0A1S8BB31_9PEZI|nr:Pyrimidine pathway regulatory protein 1 [Diplodia seriata]
MCMLFLIIAIGSRALESQLGADFASASYLAASIKFLADIPLHESIQAVQILLLLVLSSFCFPGGSNAWFLTHTILASCLDLGLQRKQPMETDVGRPHIRFGGTVAAHDIRSGVFWSAYSLDRTLCTTLGRPLTLRDEAIDIEFPGQQGSDEVDLDAIEGASQALQPLSTGTPINEDESNERQPKRIRSDQPPHHGFYAANMSFRFDRIVAEVKLMIHRVAQSPRRFPWPSDFEGWQKAVHASCKGLLEHAQQTLSRRAGGISRAISYRSMPSIELKYHQCVMLLYRPSPAFPRPAPEALNICFDSATETIRIYYELHRFGQMMNSWLTGHSIFVSAITMLYCLWIGPAIRARASNTFAEHARRCSETLEALGKTWSVAKDARVKFDRLVEATSESWRRRQEPVATELGPEQPVGVQDGTEQSFDALFDSAGVFSDELGDMSGWFDLEWFETYGVEGLGNTITA